jgi:hemoglobin
MCGRCFNAVSILSSLASSSEGRFLWGKRPVHSLFRKHPNRPLSSQLFCRAYHGEMSVPAVESPRLITEEEISTLVDRFYAKVRLDTEIGPIFNSAIENWDAHMALLKDFWSTVLRTTGRYKGNPLLAHFPLPIEPRSFIRWLALFEETARETLPAPLSAQVVLRARSIAANMQRVLSGHRS